VFAILLFVFSIPPFAIFGKFPEILQGTILREDVPGLAGF